eukprot:95215-Amorphochlora_amoeboformis.AAC.2
MALRGLVVATICVGLCGRMVHAKRKPPKSMLPELIGLEEDSNNDIIGSAMLARQAVSLSAGLFVFYIGVG